MTMLVRRLGTWACPLAAILLALASFSVAFVAAGGRGDLALAQTGGGPMVGGSGFGGGGSGAPGGGGPMMGGGGPMMGSGGPMMGGGGPMMGGGGPMMGGGMAGMGGRAPAGAGGGGGLGVRPPSGVGWTAIPDASVPMLQDYEPTAASWAQSKEWEKLLERYEVSLEWARQIDAKWRPVRQTELHYRLAALGASRWMPATRAFVESASLQNGFLGQYENLLATVGRERLRPPMNPEALSLEARRSRLKMIEQIVAEQRALIPEEIASNLRESARVAVARKVRYDPVVDKELYEKRVAEEYEYLVYVYLVGYDAAPWFRTNYDPTLKTYDDSGRPVLASATPPPWRGDPEVVDAAIASMLGGAAVTGPTPQARGGEGAVPGGMPTGMPGAGGFSGAPMGMRGPGGMMGAPGPGGAGPSPMMGRPGVGGGTGAGAGGGGGTGVGATANL